MLTSHCHICGQPKSPAEYSLNHCTACDTRGNEAANHAAAENPDATADQLAYIKRMAMQGRAVRPTSNMVDPRVHQQQRGMIPIPPPGNDRGSIPS